MGFPVFCRGTCMRGTTKGILGSVNLPILFGEVPVKPGDLVLGDDDGLVIVPQADIEKVLAASRKRVETEKQKAAVLAGGVSSVEFNKLEPVFRVAGHGGGIAVKIAADHLRQASAALVRSLGVDAREAKPGGGQPGHGGDARHSHPRGQFPAHARRAGRAGPGRASHRARRS